MYPIIDCTSVVVAAPANFTVTPADKPSINGKPTVIDVAEPVIPAVPVELPPSAVSAYLLLGRRS